MSDVEPYIPGSQRGLPKYTKVYHLGDPHISDLLHGPVDITEKVDGSQFRFGRKDGVMHYGSKGVDYDDAHPIENSFRAGTEYIATVADVCPEGLVFFAEYMTKPKQNTIAYTRMVKNHVMLFGALNNGQHNWIDKDAGYALAPGEWADPEQLGYWSEALDIDPPNVLFEGEGTELTEQRLRELLSTQSYLGGSTIEGIVIKRYNCESPDPFHPLMLMAGKYVRKSFQEENTTNWRNSKDVISQIGLRFRTDARFEKAVIHARDEGTLQNNMKDMVPLLQQLDKDIDEEIKPLVLEMLWNRWERDIRQVIKSGLAEFYKTRLLNRQFE
jgi:hypothetical protein